jgi:hypothetical protein
MTTKTSSGLGKQRNDIMIAILVLGSLWGLSEVVLNGAIRAAGLPFRAGILAGVGMFLMGVALGIFRKPLMLVGVGVIAVLCKQLVVPIMGTSVLCKANACIALLFQSSALLGVATLMGQRIQSGRIPRIMTGFSAALVASPVFYFIGMRVAPCNYLLSFNRPEGLMAFMVAEGLVWAAFSAALFPMGWRLGSRLEGTIPQVRAVKPVLYYGASLGVVLCAWVASGLAYAAGF